MSLKCPAPPSLYDVDVWCLVPLRFDVGSVAGFRNPYWWLAAGRFSAIVGKSKFSAAGGPMCFSTIGASPSGPRALEGLMSLRDCSQFLLVRELFYHWKWKLKDLTMTTDGSKARYLLFPIYPSTEWIS